MTDNKKQWIAWVLVTVAVLVAGVLGIQYPLPDPPDSPLALISAESLETGHACTLIVPASLKICTLIVPANVDACAISLPPDLDTCAVIVPTRLE